MTAPSTEPVLGDALSQPRIVGLDFVRAIAVLLVLLGHTLEGIDSIGSLIFGRLAGLGVEIFFVLSGFLITWLLLQERQKQGDIDFLGFYRRRVARLFPALLLYLLIAISVLLVRGREVPWPAVASTVFYVVNYYQAFNGAATNIVSHCWSLAVEEQFYLIWPPLLAAVVSRGLSLKNALLVVIVGVWLLRLVMFNSGVSVDYLYRGLEVRADHLATGGLLAVLLADARWRRRIDDLASRPLAALAALAALIASAHGGAFSAAWRYDAGFMLEPLLSAFLIAAAIRAAAAGGALAKLLEHPLPVLMGQVSYGMYLFHGLLMYTTQRIVLSATGSLWLAVLAACLGVFVFAVASFRLYEQPLRRWISGSRSQSQSPAVRVA